MIRDEEGENYVNNFIIYDINMVKCRNLWYTNDESLKEYKYLTMLDLEVKDLEKLSKNDKVVSKYMKILEEVNENPEFREYMSMEEDAIKMENSHIAAGIEKGIAIGKEQAKKEKEQIARNFIRNGVDISIIADSTGLSIEEINSLK